MNENKNTSSKTRHKLTLKENRLKKLENKMKINMKKRKNNKNK